MGGMKVLLHATAALLFRPATLYKGAHIVVKQVGKVAAALVHCTCQLINCTECYTHVSSF
jgi:hypothetical protein